MMEPIPMLDHGHIRLVETWGRGDHEELGAAIIQAARQSTRKGSFNGWERDRGLLRYLLENKHSGPFEFAGATFEVRAPKFVIAQWQRHRSEFFGFNEISARYRPMIDDDYIPTADRLMMTSSTNKQAGSVRGSDELTPEFAQLWSDEVREAYSLMQDLYQRGLQGGVPKELARAVLPFGRYTQVWVTANIRSWLAFLTLRMDPHAQWEIRQYALAVGKILATVYPEVWAIYKAPYDTPPEPERTRKRDLVRAFLAQCINDFDPRNA